MTLSTVPIDRIVRVEVRKRGKTFQSTGYRFSTHRVVTAFHAVEGAETIRVLDPDGGSWKDSGILDYQADHGVLWPLEGSNSPDAAILATPAIAGIIPSAVREDPWTHRCAWQSHGFHANEPMVLKGLFGEAFPCQPGAAGCELTVRDTHVDNLESWGGLSGSPIFLELPGTGLVFAGVIGEGPRNAKGSRLWATTLPALLGEPTFRDALLGEAPPWFEDYVRLVHEKLEGDAQATTAVRLAFGETSAGSAPKDLAQQAVLDTDLGDVCRALARAARKLDGEGKSPSGDRVRAVLRAVAPVRFLRAQGMTPPDATSRRLELDVATDLGAEAVVAAMQRRLMEVEPVLGDLPRPKWKVSEPGVFGIDLTGEAALQDLVEELRQLVELAPGIGCHARSYLIHLAQKLEILPPSLVQRVGDWDPSDETWSKVVSRAVNRRLEDLDGSERFYFLMSLEKDRERREQFLEHLGEDLPALLLVTRKSRDLDQWDAEDAQLQNPLGQAHTGSPPEDDTQ